MIAVLVEVGAEPVREYDVFIRPTVSPKIRRDNAAPPQPELFEITTANRGSVAPAQSAVLPSREWPITVTFLASISGMVSRKSSARLRPQAQAAIEPHSSGAGRVWPGR